MTLLEPDVTLTDYGLAVECAVLAWLAWRKGAPASAQRFWITVFFSALGVAALMGGTAHGFFANKQSAGHRAVWEGTLLALGLVALAGWSIGARMVLREHIATWVVRVAAAIYVVYAAIVIFVRHDFFVAIVHYLPAALFLFVAFLIAWRRDGGPRLLAGAFGMLLTLIAAGVQQAKIGFHPQYFNHNALYHLVQAVALVFIYVGARRLVRA